MIDTAMRLGLAASMAGLVDDIRARRQRRAAMRALERVDNATLKDIGMSRAELMSVCYGDTTGRRHGNV